MAGYIFTLGNTEDAFQLYKDTAKSGVFGTKFNKPTKKTWSAAIESTIGDYLSMREGDQIYFFFKREIYGVGKLIKVHGDVRHLNFPGSEMPHPNLDKIKESDFIINDKAIRIVITFESSPFFFEKGVDMDKVLNSNPSAFRMLRAMWNVSFMKLDEIENNALFDIILRENLKKYKENIGIITERENHKRILELKKINNHSLTTNTLLAEFYEETRIKHEMLIECDLIEKITEGKLTDIFGKWDYLSHQVVASPFKPIPYMDKMDVFGYQKIDGYSTLSRFMCIEIKKGIADISSLTQVMKYVDWIHGEYAFSDYSMIDAYIVANVIPIEVKQLVSTVGIRNYTSGFRDKMKNEVWTNLHLVEYKYDEIKKEITYKIINE